MPGYKVKSPVALLIFNRPGTTRRVFEAIARARPERLLVVADGPRANREGEAERCREARQVIESVDWDCEVSTNYSDHNLGCKERVASGMSWVFGEVPEAIILEDDCLPHPDFFRFCDELLEKYRDDERIGMIAGANFQFDRNRPEASYYYSRYSHIWGWASWFRAWQHYDKQVPEWPVFRDQGLLDELFASKNERKYWRMMLDGVYEGQIDTWDYQWAFTNWAQGRLSVIPRVNLVSNIGFGPEATHTQNASVYADMGAQGLDFPLIAPRFVQPYAEADRYTARRMYTRSLWRRIWNRFSAMTAG